MPLMFGKAMADSNKWFYDFPLTSGIPESSRMVVFGKHSMTFLTLKVWQFALHKLTGDARLKSLHVDDDDDDTGWLSGYCMDAYW